MNLHQIIVFKHPQTQSPPPWLAKEMSSFIQITERRDKEYISIYNLPAHRAQAHFDPQVQEIFDETLYLGILQSESEQYITS